MTVRTLVRDAIIAALNTDRPTGIPEAGKRRFLPGQRLVDRRLAVFFNEEGAERQGGRRGPITQRNLIFGVQAAAAVEDPGEADDAVEDILEWIVAVLGENSLDGKATDVTELGTVWAVAQADLIYVVALTRWKIEFQTLRDDLSDSQ